MHTSLDPFVAAELTYRRERLDPSRERPPGTGRGRRRARRTSRPAAPTPPTVAD